MPSAGQLGGGGVYIPDYKGPTQKKTGGTPSSSVNGQSISQIMRENESISQAAVAAGLPRSGPVNSQGQQSMFHFGTPDAGRAYLSGLNGSRTPAYQQPPGGGGGGGGGYGGGGGGGGGMTGLTAEQMRAMQALFNPQLMQYAQFKGPAYQQYTPSARDASIYDTARKRITGARDADLAYAEGLWAQAAQQMAEQQNPFSDYTPQLTPQMQQAYQRIVGGAPGNAQVANTISAENAYSQNSDGAFQNLMAILSGQEERNMQSRQREVAQDRNAAVQGIRAQGAGMMGGVEMADLQDAREYQRYLDQVAREESRYGQDRTYQNALLNWQARNQVNQGNVGIKNDAIASLLGLIPSITDASVLASIPELAWLDSRKAVA